MGHDKAESFRIEDSAKTSRLATLHKVFGLPIDQPTTFSADAVIKQSPAFADFMKQHGDDLCALRLVPAQEGWPKLRMRGMTVREVVMKWLPKQEIDPDNYAANFFQHSEQINWSAIFVVNLHGVFGEAIADGLAQLSQGVTLGGVPEQFRYDFRDWKMTGEGHVSIKQVQLAIASLKVGAVSLRQRLKTEVGVTFSGEYIKGYFEVVDDEFGLHFVDYNRMLGEFYDDWQPGMKGTDGLAGQGVSQGTVRGRVRIVHDSASVSFEAGEILVCQMTTPDFVPLMKRAAAIVTDYGGLLSHAAIVARELGKPCIVGTKNATQALKDGDMVEVDADAGVVRIVRKKELGIRNYFPPE